jgi:succinate dehydrogenase / fumarate reductase iron-sulfur subunit
MSQKVKLIIKRYDPSKDKKSYFHEYDVEVEPWNTVLEALQRIRKEIDTTLVFRMSCRSGICGSCAMRINGRAKLACRTKIKDEFKEFGEIKIEPIGNLKVQKDLMVDMEPFFEEMKQIKPWFDKVIFQKNENSMKPDDVKIIEKSSQCIWCGACFSDCPSREFDSKYLGPAASVLAHRYIFDVRDTQKRERLKNLLDKQIWMCAHCEKSTENCPQNIDPQEVISKLREESIKEGLTHSPGARHAKTVTKTVVKYGEVAESRLPLGALGIFKVIKEIPMALKTLIKGKFPPLFMKKIKDLEEVKQLMNDVKKNE